MPDWILFMLFVAMWSPPLVFLHELGHAAVALIVTEGEVELALHRGGLDGGWVSHDPATLRRPKDAAWIAAAGPACSLVAMVILWISWEMGDDSGLAGFLGFWGTGALLATFHFLLSAIPARYGKGFDPVVSETDGMAVWRLLTGNAPPVDIVLGDPLEPASKTRPWFLVALVVIVLLAFLVDPLLALMVGGVMFVAVLIDLL